MMMLVQHVHSGSSPAKRGRGTAPDLIRAGGGGGPMHPSSATPSWFDTLTMRAAEKCEALILSLSKDEGRVRGGAP